MKRNLYFLCYFEGKTMKKIVLLTMFVLIACSDIPSEFSLPKWDADFNLPICSRFYYIDDMVKLDKDVSIDPENHLYVYQSKGIDDKHSIIEFVDNRIDTTYRDYEMQIVNGRGRASFAYPEGIENDSCHFAAGTIKFSMKSNSDEEYSAKITFPTVLNAEAEIYSFQKVTSAQSKVEKEQNIAGFSHSSKGYPKDSLVIEVEILNGNAGQSATLNLEIKNVSFCYLRGYAPAKVISQVSSSKYLPLDEKLKEFEEGLKFWDPELILEAKYISTLNLENIFGAEIQNLQVLGKKADGKERFLENINGSNNLGNYRLNNGYLYEKLDNSNSKLSDFLNFLPDSVFLIGDLLINPDGKFGEIKRTDSINVSYELNLKSYLTIENLALLDTIPLEFNAETISNLKKAKGAILTMKVENYSPLATEIEAIFADSSEKVLFSRTFQVNSGIVNSEGFTSSSSSSIAEFVFDEKDMQDLANSHYFIVKTNFNSANNPQKVAIRSDDWLKVISFIKLKYTVDI